MIIDRIQALCGNGRRVSFTMERTALRWVVQVEDTKFHDVDLLTAVNKAVRHWCPQNHGGTGK